MTPNWEVPESGPHPPAPAASYPFWDYHDLVLFLGAAAPSLMMATAALFLLRKFADGHLNKAMQTLLLQFVAYALWFLALYAIFHFRHRRPFWDSLAWSGTARGVVLSLLAGPLVAFGVAFASLFLETPVVATPLQDLLRDRLSVLLVGFFAVTFGPLCEELAFRGFLMPLVSRSLGDGYGILLSSVPFALLHGPQYAWSWRHLMLIGLAGVAFGWARYRTGSTAAAAAMHGAYNLTFFLGFLLLEGDTLRPW